MSSLQVKESLSIPVVANGDIKCESDVRNVHQVTGVNGNVLWFLERHTGICMRVDECKHKWQLTFQWVLLGYCS